eukprot:87065-Chlamydomonas_euryale.AAC.2
MLEEDPSFCSYGEAYDAYCARYGREGDTPISHFKTRCAEEGGSIPKVWRHAHTHAPTHPTVRPTLRPSIHLSMQKSKKQREASPKPHPSLYPTEKCRHLRLENLPPRNPTCSCPPSEPHPHLLLLPHPPSPSPRDVVLDKRLKVYHEICCLTLLHSHTYTYTHTRARARAGRGAGEAAADIPGGLPADGVGKRVQPVHLQDAADVQPSVGVQEEPVPADGAVWAALPYAAGRRPQPEQDPVCKGLGAYLPERLHAGVQRAGAAGEDGA